MQTACWEMPWFRALRAVALVLAVVLGLEWTVSLGGYAQSNTEPASAPAANVGDLDLPPIQEAESVEARSPFYKTWWFWAIVAVVVGAAALLAVAVSDPPSPGLGASKIRQRRFTVRSAVAGATLGVSQSSPSIC